MKCALPHIGLFCKTIRMITLQSPFVKPFPCARCLLPPPFCAVPYAPMYPLPYQTGDAIKSNRKESILPGVFLFSSLFFRGTVNLRLRIFLLSYLMQRSANVSITFQRLHSYSPWKCCSGSLFSHDRVCYPHRRGSPSSGSLPLEYHSRFPVKPLQSADFSNTHA